MMYAKIRKLPVSHIFLGIFLYLEHEPYKAYLWKHNVIIALNKKVIHWPNSVCLIRTFLQR